MKHVVVAGMARTPIGKFMGGLSSFSAPQLGSYAIKEAVRRANISPENIEGYRMGLVLSAGVGQNPARQAAILAGIPVEVGGYTIDRVCGSGLQAIISAIETIQVGKADVMVAGGMESMSQSPHFHHMRQAKKIGNIQDLDSMIHDGLWCPFNDAHMGTLAERVKDKYDISREELDEFSLRSHQRAIDARIKLMDEIISIDVDGKIIQYDEGPRENINLETLSRSKSAFIEDGMITAGNSSQLSDGAAALVLMSRRAAKKYGITPIAVLGDYAEVSVKPEDYMFAPARAVKKLLKQTGNSLDDYDIVESNEAFAIQAKAFCNELNLNEEKLNVYGGAIALGHPIGASGARLTGTAINALHQENENTAIVTLCIGLGDSLALEIKMP